MMVPSEVLTSRLSTDNVMMFRESLRTAESFTCHRDKSENHGYLICWSSGNDINYNYLKSNISVRRKQSCLTTNLYVFSNLSSENGDKVPLKREDHISNIGKTIIFLFMGDLTITFFALNQYL